MSSDDPLSSLRPSRPVDPGFADRLEASLRIEHARQQPHPVPGSPWRRVALVGPALVLVVAVASAVLILRDDSPTAALELREADNVTVTLVDGTALIDPDGLDLVDGTMISVGEGGRAVIGDVELGPGSVVTVRDGELVTADPATTTSSQGSDETAGSSPPSTTAPTISRPAESDQPRRADETEEPANDRPRTTEPIDPDQDGPDGVADPPRTTLPPEVVDPGPHPDPPPEPVDPRPDRVVDLALAVRHQDGAVAIGWRATGTNLEGVRVLLVRSHGPDAPDPDWPSSSPGVTVVAETSGSEPGGFVDDLPAPDSLVRYRAVALHGDEVVARSVVQTLTTDR